VGTINNHEEHIPRVYMRHDQWNKEQETATRGEQQDHTRGQTRKNRKRAEERELEEETYTPRDTRLASRIHMRAKPSPGHAREVRQAVSFRPVSLMRMECSVGRRKIRALIFGWAIHLKAYAWGINTHTHTHCGASVLKTPVTVEWL
jgi:hypothetical protein